VPPPRAILLQVRAFAREHALFRPGPIVVALSGGTDSTALLLLLADLAGDFGLTLHAAHFDHRTRPRRSAADAAFAADLASRVGATIRLGRASAAPRSEDDARRARFAFLRRAAAELGATAIATGHTRDDQAETVILHLVRGSGLAGLAAMRPAREGIVRPLLCLGRAETAAVCRAAGIAPREDPTNRSLRFARNRVRRRVLPELARLNPRVSEALARLADAAAGATDSLERRARALLDGALQGDTVELDRLGDDPVARSAALALAWERFVGRRLDARHRAALEREAARREGSASLDLPGARAEREYGGLRIVARTGRASPAAPTDASRPRRLEEGVPLGWRGWEFLLTRSSPDGWPLARTVPKELAGALAVRGRRPGDRLTGAVPRKVQDALTDAKVPARLRAWYPLVVAPDGLVWWLPGVSAVTGAGRGGLRLLARAPAGEANGFWPRRVRQVASTKKGHKVRA